MINTRNVMEQIFKCKIGSKFFFIKLYLIYKQINIIVKVISEKNSLYSEYFNNYTLSHLQEINSYFKIFNDIKDIYNDLFKLLNSKNFMLSENEDETLSFIIKVQINEQIRNIELTLTKLQKKIAKSKTMMENGMSNPSLNYELNALKNRIIALEKSQGVPPTSSRNNYIYPDMYKNRKNNKLENIIFKINQLENENNNKNEKIKSLEEKLNFYEKNSIYNNNNYMNNNNLINLTKSNNSKLYNFSINSNNFEIVHNNRNKNRNNSIQKIRPYNSMERYRNKNRNASSDYKNDNRKRNMMNSSSVKMGDYYNNIPIVRRENILNLNSRIIFTNKEVQLLTRRISLGNKNKKVNLNLLYRASIDGDTEPILKLNTRNKSKTLTLFYTNEGARFGVYTEKKGVKSILGGYELYEVPGTSFIIGLNNLIYYNVKAKQTSLYDKSDNMLCFGFCSKINNNETNWLIYTSRNYFLGKKYLFGDKNDVYLNLDYKKIVGNNPSYHIKDVEIFDVVVETLK